MSNTRMYVGSAGVVAVALVIYLALFAPNPTGDDVTGTINTVQKYQTDQMSDTDVILEGEEVIIHEMAELYDHATIEEQAELLGAATKEMTISILGRCEDDVHASIWGFLEKNDQVDAFNAVNIDKESFLGRANMTLGSFSAMNRESQVQALQGATVQEKAEMFQRAPKKAQLHALARMDLKGRAAVMQGANVREKAMLIGRAPIPTRQAILKRMDMQGRTDLVRNATLQGKSYMFNRAAEVDRQAMLQGATVIEKADLFGRLELQDQIDGVMGNLKVSKDVSFLNRGASVAEAKAFFDQATPNIHKCMFGRLTESKQDIILQRMSITKETFGQLHLEDQSRALLGATALDKQAMLGQASLQEVQSLLSKASVSNWKILLGRLEMQDKADSFNRVNKKIQLSTLGQAPIIQAAMLERAPDTRVANVLGRSFLDSSSF